jgi:hypothetical protein
LAAVTATVTAANFREIQSWPLSPYYPPEAFFILIVSLPEDPVRNKRFLLGSTHRDSHIDPVSLILAKISESYSDDIQIVRLCIYGDEVRGLGTT